ncbi:DUF6968 family protein [Chondromyces apiculatus]|uniref:DUF6968 family protein n=1 Tax=Chondromyces apiculatus TaxID=51 RepID=UPI0012DC231B|nr:hypothetical protein [Chondromyces apiculatus]
MTPVKIRGESSWIALTELACDLGQGSKSQVTVAISAPVTDADRGISRCSFRIAGLRQGTIEQETCGADTYQALVLCVQRVGIELALAKRHQRLTWANTEDDDLGFPVDVFENVTKPRRTAYLPKPDSSLRESIREGFSLLRLDPGQAGKVLGRLRRRCLQLDLVDSATMCLQGELAAARAMKNVAEESRLTRLLARQQPSADNLLAVAEGFVNQGKQNDARKYLLQASAVAEHGTTLHRLITEKLAALRGPQQKPGATVRPAVGLRKRRKR